MELLTDTGLSAFLIFAIIAFIAGFIDAVVGGGGLIQIPALLIGFPNSPVATLFGTNKISPWQELQLQPISILKELNSTIKYYYW